MYWKLMNYKLYRVMVDALLVESFHKVLQVDV